MRTPDIEYKKLVLVCVNEREKGMESCGKKGSLELFQKLKACIREADPQIRISKTGCLGNCLSGITIAIQPDNIWFGDVTEKDLDELAKLILS